MPQDLTWQEWLAAYRANHAMEVRRCTLGALAQGIPQDKSHTVWRMQPSEVFGREDGAFFHLTGARISLRGGEREVAAWSQPMLVESGEGRVVLLRRGIRYLLQAKLEPGNPVSGNRVLIAPTIQASESNLAQKHGGRRPRHAERLDTADGPRWYKAPQDGGRFDQKVNQYAVIPAGSRPIQIDPDSERWFDVNELAEVIVSGEANQHLREAFGFIWAAEYME